jgi:predicted secreted acid phosphatase
MYRQVLDHQFRAIACAVRAMPPGRLVVLDIDETCLDNVQHVRGHPATHNDIIPECRQMFEAMRRAELKYAFVSGRRERLRAETLRDLKRAGLGDHEAVYLCPDDFTGDMWQFKAGARRDLENQGYAIAATIGDQISDITGGHTGVIFLLHNPHYRADARGTDILL